MALETHVRQMVEASIADRLAVFSLLAKDSYSQGEKLFDYIEGFSVAPIRVQKMGCDYPNSRSEYFLSGRNANLQDRVKPFGVLPKSDWNWSIPKVAHPGQEGRELMSDWDVCFLQASAVPTAHVETLSIAAKRFLELDDEKRKSFLLDGSLVPSREGREFPFHEGQPSKRNGRRNPREEAKQ